MKIRRKVYLSHLACISQLIIQRLIKQINVSRKHLFAIHHIRTQDNFIEEKATQQNKQQTATRNI